MATLFYDGPPRVFHPMPVATMVERGVPLADAEEAWRAHNTREMTAAVAKINAAAYGNADPAEAVTMYALYDEALRYDAAGRPAVPSLTDFPHMAGREAAARGMTISEFCNYAIATGQAWAAFAAEVRGVRAELTAAIAASPTPEDVSAIVDPALASLRVAASSL